MKPAIPVPHEKLLWFQGKLDLLEKDMEKIQQYGHVFAQKKVQLGDYLYEFFYEIREARFVIESERTRGFLLRMWAQWFELLFTQRFSHKMLGYMWRSGLRHVELNIDKRLINLAYSKVRQFCQDIAWKEVPLKDLQVFLSALDKMVDFCLLIETYAYVSATSRCDMEVVKGISHQVRNPLTVIGGNVMRLKRDAEAGSQALIAYETILDESRRLEMMVKDVVAYSEMLQREPFFTVISLKDVITAALNKLKQNQSLKKAQIEFSPDAGLQVHGDADDLEIIFYQLLQNSLEAVNAGVSSIRISVQIDASDRRFARVEILNTGEHLTDEEISNIFVPFYSSNPYGTGLGLPMAQLAARKNLGRIDFEQVEGLGTKCIVLLPVFSVPEKD
jgi:signal transduction histidine kinase